MSDFEPDAMRQMHETPDYAAEQAPPQLADHEIFSEAFEAQADLGKHELERDDVDEFWRNHRHIADSLTAKAKQAGLLNKDVTVVGEGIELFNKTMSVADKRTVVSPMSDEKRIEECMKSTMRPDAYRGDFGGFGLGFTKKYADTGGELFTPVLEYQIRDKTNWITQNTSFTVSSTAFITTANIFFEKDLQLIEGQRIIDALHLLAPYSKDHIKLLNGFLAKSSLTIADLRNVSYYSNEIITNNGTVATLLEDSICDLIKHRLKRPGGYSMRSNVHLQNDDTQPGVKKLYVEDGTYDSPVHDVVFLDDNPFMPQDRYLRSERSIYFIVGDSEAGTYYYIPVSGLSEFTNK